MAKAALKVVPKHNQRPENALSDQGSSLALREAFHTYAIALYQHSIRSSRRGVSPLTPERVKSVESYLAYDLGLVEGSDKKPVLNEKFLGIMGNPNAEGCVGVRPPSDKTLTEKWFLGASPEVQSAGQAFVALYEAEHGADISGPAPAQG